MSALQKKIDKLLQSEGLYSKKALLIPLVLPASLVVILTIYVQLWYLFTPNPNSFRSTQPTQSPVISDPTPGNGPVKSTTYRNDALAFSFDYPDYLTLNPDGNQYGSLLTIHIEDAQTNKMAYGADNYMNKYFSVNLTVYPQNPTNLASQFATKACTVITAASDIITKQDKADCEQRVKASLTPYSNGIIGGYSGNVQGYESSYFVVLFNHDGNTYEFSSYGYEGTPPSSYSNRLLSEIIASIEFGGVVPTPKAFDGCAIGGCSSELCIDPTTDTSASICVYRTDYACLAYSTCERQNGICGWKQTPQYLRCLQNS